MSHVAHMKGNDHMTAHQTAQQAVVRRTERSRVICSASPNMVHFLSVSSCQLFGITPNMSNLCLIPTMNVYNAGGWRAMSEILRKFDEKWSKLVKMWTIASMTSKDLSQRGRCGVLRSLLLQGHVHVVNGLWCQENLMQK